MLNWDRTKAKTIDFSNTACHSQLIVFFLLKLSFLILHDLPSQSSSLWHAAISAVAQGIVNRLFIKKTSLSPPGTYTFYYCKTFEGQAVQGLPLFTISRVSWYVVCTIQPADSLKQCLLFIYWCIKRWYNCPWAKRWGCICCPAYLDRVRVRSAGTLMKRDSSWPRKYVPFIFRSLRCYCVA